MTSLFASFPKSRFRSVLDSAIGDELAALSGALATFFAAVTVAHRYMLPPEAAAVMSPLAAVSAALLLAIFLTLRRYSVPERWAHPLAFLVGSTALANCVVHLYLLGRPEDTTNFAVVVAASGWLLLSRAWLGAGIALVWGSWSYIAFVVYPHEDWDHFAFFLFAATVLGVIVQAARRRMIVRLYRAEAELRAMVDRLEELVDERTRELESSQEKLRRSERLASVGTLAAGIAHEINNPVGMILLSAEEALHRLDESASESHVARLLHQIVDNAKRCGGIVKSVLRFARQQPSERTPSDINTVVRRAVELTRSFVAQRGGTIETALDPTPSVVLLNAGEMEQVVVNLITNGIEAAAGTPVVKIRTECAANMVRVHVSDNGAGMTEEVRTRVFDPFYTTRQAQGGTGLGLSLAFGLVSSHGGTIRVSSTPGQGATIVVELPAPPPTGDM